MRPNASSPAINARGQTYPIKPLGVLVTRSCDASASNIYPNKRYHCAMCAGVASCHFGRVVYFRDAGATLPVKLRSGGVRLIPWGRRRYQRGSLPVGACAEWESIKAGAWVSYQPIPVKLAVDHYMRDEAGFHDWFELGEGQYLQGLVANYGGEQRVYVVTVRRLASQG
jgi:hypothetical protein